MPRYFVKEVKNDSVSAGPSGSVITAINYEDGGKNAWITLVDVDGIVNLSLTEDDIFDKCVESDDEEFWDYVNEQTVSEFGGFEIGESCADIAYAINGKTEEDMSAKLLQYLILLTFCDSTEDLIQRGTGKYIDDVDLSDYDMVEIFDLEDEDYEDDEDYDEDEDYDDEDYDEDDDEED